MTAAVFSESRGNGGQLQFDPGWNDLRSSADAATCGIRHSLVDTSPRVTIDLGTFRVVDSEQY
jgi:hypothetical protein